MDRLTDGQMNGQTEGKYLFSTEPRGRCPKKRAKSKSNQNQTYQCERDDGEYRAYHRKTFRQTARRFLDKLQVNEQRGRMSGEENLTGKENIAIRYHIDNVPVSDQCHVTNDGHNDKIYSSRYHWLILAASS